MTQDWRAGAELLRKAGIESADRDAQKLARAEIDFASAIARRATGEPVSHIFGQRSFWKHDFKVTSDVLDPRPDTETLVEHALGVPFTSVLDLGTGSGCILLSLLDERPDAVGVGVDISPAALEVARENAGNLGNADRATLRQSNWFSNVEGTFDLIASNPPYIDAESYRELDRGVREFEPQMALTPGGDGLDAYRTIATTAAAYLNAGGWLMVEIGFDQGQSVPEIFASVGWSTDLIYDLNGHARVVKAQIKG
ncbi:MAG: peptide chain release factor N(5)-glutamine methyltransferase [Litoreibacter sp.]